MDHWKKPLDLEIGDTIVWQGEGIRICNDREGLLLIAPGMKGKVITRSENLLAHAARKAWTAHHRGAMGCNSSDLTVQTVSE